MENVQDFGAYVKNLIIQYAPDVVLALVTLIVGFWIVGLVVKAIDRAMERGNLDMGIRGFLRSIASVLFKVLVLFSVAGMLGIQTTSFIAILGAAGLAVGLALQGSLANFAGGVLILLFKPYKVGDFIDAQGHAGTVKEIQIFNTVLKTPDNKNVIIPNGAISNGSITNASVEATRRVDMVFGIGYDDDIQQFKDLLNRLIEGDERILREPKWQVVVSELADSSVNFTVRVWCNRSDYWGIYFDMHERVKIECDKANISIPYPQQDVHMYSHSQEDLGVISVKSEA